MPASNSSHVTVVSRHVPVMVPAQYGAKAVPMVVTFVHSPKVIKLSLFSSPETVKLPSKL